MNKQHLRKNKLQINHIICIAIHLTNTSDESPFRVKRYKEILKIYNFLYILLNTPYALYLTFKFNFCIVNCLFRTHVPRKIYTVDSKVTLYLYYYLCFSIKYEIIIRKNSLFFFILYVV